MLNVQWLYRTLWPGVLVGTMNAVMPRAVGQAKGRPPVHRDTRGVLIDEAATSPERGHWRVAIRRFLMLRACGFEIPWQDRQVCEALVSSCPEEDLLRIRNRVQSWVDMLVPPAHEAALERAARSRGPWFALIASVMK